MAAPLRDIVRCGTQSPLGFRELGILSQIGELTGAAADRLHGHGAEPVTGRRVVSISPVMVVSRSLGGGKRTAHHREVGDPLARVRGPAAGFRDKLAGREVPGPAGAYPSWEESASSGSGSSVTGNWCGRQRS